MKVKANEREFNIFELFLHDADGTAPFDAHSLAVKLNELAEAMCPESFVMFMCPDDAYASSHWYVRFNTDRYECDGQGERKFQTYPSGKVHDERAFRRTLPPELDELMLELNKSVVAL